MRHLEIRCRYEFSIFDVAESGCNTADWEAVRNRIRRAAVDRGIEFSAILDFLGLDILEEDYIDRKNKLPKTQTAMAVAAFLGVSASWVLTGKEPRTGHINHQRISDTADSAVIQGNNSGTITIHNAAAPMSEQKRELNRIFDALPIRAQTKLLHIAYEMEEDGKSA